MDAHLHAQRGSRPASDCYKYKLKISRGYPEHVAYDTGGAKCRNFRTMAQPDLHKIAKQ